MSTEAGQRRPERVWGARMKSGMKYFDYSLVAVIVFLICFGLVMLYSASAYSAEVNYSGD